MNKKSLTLALMLLAALCFAGFSVLKAQTKRSVTTFRQPNRKVATYKTFIPAGPIFGTAEARIKAPRIARAWGGKWTRDESWKTVVSNQMSVVELELPVKRTGTLSHKAYVLAGPLYSGAEAKKFAPSIAASHGGTWTGEWKTITSGRMSVIEVEWKY